MEIFRISSLDFLSIGGGRAVEEATTWCVVLLFFASGSCRWSRDREEGAPASACSGPPAPPTDEKKIPCEGRV